MLTVLIVSFNDSLLINTLDFIPDEDRMSYNKHYVTFITYETKVIIIASLKVRIRNGA